MRIATIVLLAAALSGCGMNTDTPENRAAAMASLFNKTKGMTVGAKADDLSARADGKTMVLTFKNAVEEGVVVPQDEAKAGITQLVCGNKSYTAILDQGVDLRVEMFDKGGKALPPVTIDACPGGAANAG